MEDIITGKYNKPYQSNKLKTRLLEEGYKEYKCERCGLTEWLGDPIPLQLHHKDGIHNNNILENLELLCPNCHTLTDNFGGKNVKHVKIVKKSEAKRPTKKGISEDGKRLYDGYGNYKVLCPVCNINFMNREASECKECYEKERLIPKVPKEKLYQIINETSSYVEAGEKLGYDRKTISRWHRYYAAQDKRNNIAVIASENAPSRDVLKEEIRKYSFPEIGRMHGGVDGNAVKRWCNSYALPHLRSEIDKISDEDWINI